MSEPFVGEIRMFAGNFAPRSWAFCDGQLLTISQNDALFSLLGTNYGGDGRTTFGLPDLRGRLPIHAGTGPGLSARRLGTKLGTEQVALTVNELPSHGHAMSATSDAATDTLATGKVLAQVTGANMYRSTGSPQPLNPASVSDIGGSRSHTNLMPYLCVNFIIALFGIYPSRQ